MKCKKCGNYLNDDVKFCSNCGQKVDGNNTKKIIIIIIILLSILILGGLGYFIAKKLDNNLLNNEIKDNNDNSEQEMEYTFDLFDTNMPMELKDDNDISKNIEIYGIFTNPGTSSKTSSVYVYGKNNNDKAVKVHFEIEYYDAEGYRIESSHTSSIVNSGSEFVIQDYAENDSIGYKSTKLLYYAKKLESYYTVVDLNDLEVTDVLSDNKIKILIKNNSSIKLKSTNIGCVYYKDGNVVFANKGYVDNDIDINGIGTAIIYTYTLQGYDDSKKIEFDDYKVILYSSYSYDSENY